MWIQKLNRNFCKNISFYLRSKQFISRTIATSNVSRQVQEDFIIKSKRPSLNYPKILLDQFIWRNSEQWMNKIAIVDGFTDQSLTYAQIRDKCRAFAIRLRTVLDLKPNDTIAICLPNSIEFPIVSFGAFEADTILTTINPLYTADEISRQLIDSDTKVLVGHAAMSKVLIDAVQKTKKLIKIVYATGPTNVPVPAGGIKLDELIDTNGLELSSLARHESDTNSICMLPYSSGTTGLSKGVKLSHYNIISNIMAINEVKFSFDAIGDHQDILYSIIPCFHISGFASLASKFMQGCKIIMIPKFTPETFLNALAKYKGNLLPLVPQIIFFMNNFPNLRPEHTMHLRHLVCGTAPLGKNDVEKFLTIAPHVNLMQCYGLTETSPLTHFTAMESKKYGSIGALLSDTEAKIVDIEDEEFRAIGPNKSGELFVRGPQVMLGYHNNEKATKETITPDGWLRTGDIGYHDEDGDFYITDRLKELIKVKGFQVAPAELEEILRTHPEISDAAVVGVPNEATGELPRAFIVTTKDSKLSEKMVRDYVADKVIEYKRLAGGVEFVESIPKNATGKILRKELKREVK